MKPAGGGRAGGPDGPGDPDGSTDADGSGDADGAADGVASGDAVGAGDGETDGGAVGAGGAVALGRNQKVGTGGVVGMSANGAIIASSIGSADSSYTTQGLWKQATGWQELMPPAPADGGQTDGSYGNVWSLSGDGTTPVGLYWRPGPGNRAGHFCIRPLGGQRRAAPWPRVARKIDSGAAGQREVGTLRLAQPST